MTHPALIERITRSLAYMLRHQPEKFDLELDSHGFGEIDDVVRALRERLDEPLDDTDLEVAVSSGDRARYEIRGSKIRALYGHSISVEPGDPCQPPEFLYVGIDGQHLQRAQQFGLRGGRRKFLHLALSADDAREAGRRAAREYAILRVYALDAWEDGVNFYDRKTLYLAEQIPTKYLEVLERGSDGYEPRQRDDVGDGRSSRGGDRDADRPRHDRPHGRDARPREFERGGPPARTERSRDERPRELERAETLHAERPRFESPRDDRPRDDRPRDDRPRDDRPRDDRPRDDRPREVRGREDRPRFSESRERFDGGRRESAPPRREFRPDSGPRVDAPRDDRRPAGRQDMRSDMRSESRPEMRSAPRPEPRRAETRPLPPAQPQRTQSPDDGSFGHGIFEAEIAPAPRREPAPERPANITPKPAPPKAKDDPFDFGAGL